MRVEADLKNLIRIRSFIEEAADRFGLAKAAASDLQLAVDEAVANIIIHGYKQNGGTIEIDVEQVDDTMIVTLSDHAPPYNPLREAPPPALELPLEQRPVGGLGVLLLKQNTDAVEYRVLSQGGNRLILKKKGLGGT